MITVYRASLDTRHFTLEAFGDTAQAATSALYSGIAVHCRQTGASVMAFRKQYDNSIEVRPITVGRAYRDGEPL